MCSVQNVVCSVLQELFTFMLNVIECDWLLDITT